MIRRTRRTSCRSGRAIVAAAAAPSVREASHDGASTDGAAAASTAAQARPRGHQRMAMHVASNAAALDWPKRRLGGSELERPPRIGWTASWSTGFVRKYLNSFYYRNIMYIRNILSPQEECWSHGGHNLEIPSCDRRVTNIVLFCAVANTCDCHLSITALGCHLTNIYRKKLLFSVS